MPQIATFELFSADSRIADCWSSRIGCQVSQAAKVSGLGAGLEDGAELGTGLGAGTRLGARLGAKLGAGLGRRLGAWVRAALGERWLLRVVRGVALKKS